MDPVLIGEGLSLLMFFGVIGFLRSPSRSPASR